MITSELMKEAIDLYGNNVVNQVVEVVSVSDADGAFSMFEDLGYYDHAEVVSLLYFNEVKHSDQLDADMEAQDWETFGENKI